MCTGGKDTPTFKTFQVAADTNGVLSLQFVASVNNAILAGVHTSDNTPAGAFPPALPPAGGLAPTGSPVGPHGPATANGTPPLTEPPKPPGDVPPLPGAGPPVPGQPHAAGGPTQAPSHAPVPSPGTATSQPQNLYSPAPAPFATLVPPMPSLVRASKVYSLCS